MIKKSNSYTVDELFNNNISTSDTDSYNILLNNSEYTYIKGLLHVDFNNHKGLLFSDIDYSDLEYDLQWNLLDVINTFDKVSYYHSLSYKDFKIIHLPSLISKLEDNDTYYIDPNITRKVGINFKKYGFEFLYKVQNYRIVNITEEVKNINTATIKNVLATTLTNLISNIKEFKNNDLSDFINKNFYNIMPNVAMNLNTFNMKFLINAKKNNILDKAYGQIENFKKITSSFLSSCLDNNIRKSYYIKTNNNYSIQLSYGPKNYYRYSVVYKFGDIRIPIAMKYWNNESQYLFIISYLMYLNEYDNLMSYFRNKLLQEL